MARIVDLRHVRREDMDVGADRERVGHRFLPLVHCGSRPTFFTTAAHKSISDLSSESSSSGELATGSPPSSIKRLR
ncbi:hypothetical protein, partial [Acinetobacter baumannii]|uniref:hypothetical protein n=1 Tax=Acinetobacter baumannii TaxID=470 RepID=UPI001BB4647D